MKLVDSKTMSALDRRSIREFSVPGIVLMENAGKGCADIIKSDFLEDSATGKNLGHKGAISVFTGSGNNGGDGFVVARHLTNYGYKVRVYSLASRPLKGDAKKNFLMWEKMGGAIKTIATMDDFKSIAVDLMHSRLIVDAMLGTGINSPLKDLYETVIDKINRLKKPIVSIDIPSGIDASNGLVMGTAIRATMTITMEVPKVGHFVYPGKDYAGTLKVVPIGIPLDVVRGFESKWNLVDHEFVSGFVIDRSVNTHKGSFGHSLTFAGSVGKGGAGKLASMAVLRAGAGLSTLAIPISLDTLMEQETTEVMTSPIPETHARTFGSTSVESAIDLLDGKDSVIIGPGCSDHGSVGDFVIELVRACRDRAIPMVIDADGLNVIAKRMKDFKRALGPLSKGADVILTPHPGEMARLLGCTPSTVQADRLKAVEELVKLTHCTVVLKGAGTIIGCYKKSNNEANIKKKKNLKIYINSTGNPGMATAGTGDILSGMIGGFLAQGYSSEEATTLATYFHGVAGDITGIEVGIAGMVATDLLLRVPKAIESVFN